MGALPKRRISTKRQGRRRQDKGIVAKQVAHHSVQSHKQGLLAVLKKL